MLRRQSKLQFRPNACLGTAVKS